MSVDFSYVRNPKNSGKRAILILHDYIYRCAGGERVAITLADAFHESRLVTGFCRDSQISCTSLDVPVDPYFLRLLWLVRRFERFSSQEKKTVFYSGNYAPLAVENHSHCLNVFYCHTPPRFLYDKRDFYLKMIPLAVRPAYICFCEWFRRKYERAVQKMDIILANSKNIRRRIRRYLHMDSVVVYPPVDTKGFKWLTQEDFFLSTARIDPLKRVNLVVRAFLQMPDKKLKVVSDGPDLSSIMSLAAGAQNIEILGWVSRETLQELTGRCTATIYVPRDEDFGISPLESMAAGKPVIGVSEGGIPETVTDGKTGMLLPSSPSEKDLVNAVCAMNKTKAISMRHECENWAKRFDKKVFINKIKKVLTSSDSICF